jgi:hypothetical protein
MKICFDACFLIAIYDQGDSYHQTALECFNSYIERRPLNTVLLPWPIMYESISRRMTRDRRKMEYINRDLKSLRISNKLEFIDDRPFRDQALASCFPIEAINYRSLSLTDIVIRQILSDRRLQTHALATFNKRDFSDVCKRFGKTIIPR